MHRAAQRRAAVRAIAIAIAIAIVYLAGRQQLVGPFVHFGEGNIEARGDDTGFVDAAVQLNNDLARATVIDHLEFTDVFCWR